MVLLFLLYAPFPRRQVVLDRDAKHTSVVGAELIVGRVIKHSDAVRVSVHYKITHRAHVTVKCVRKCSRYSILPRTELYDLL